MMNEFLEKIGGIFSTFVNVNRHKSVLVILVVLMFGVVKANVEFLNWLAQISYLF